jgi:hypothetical protein
MTWWTNCTYPHENCVAEEGESVLCTVGYTELQQCTSAVIDAQSRCAVGATVHNLCAHETDNTSFFLESHGNFTYTLVLVTLSLGIIACAVRKLLQWDKTADTILMIPGIG